MKREDDFIGLGVASPQRDLENHSEKKAGNSFFFF